MKKILYIILFFSVVLATGAHASGTLFLDAPGSVAVGEKIPITVFLDTGGTPVNSADITLGLSRPSLRLVGYQEYNGLIKFWISPPRQNGNSVSFVGGIPGGVSSLANGVSTSEDIPLVVLLFETVSPDEHTLSIEASTILQHDGLGTSFPHERIGTSFIALENYMGIQEGRRETSKEVRDTEAPVFEQLALISSSLLSKSPTLIRFSAIDEGGGIAAYNAIIGGKKIEDVQSPLVVNKKLFSYTVFLEVYDIDGNKQTASVLVPGMILGDTAVWILLLAIIFGMIIYKRVKKYAKK